MSKKRLKKFWNACKDGNLGIVKKMVSQKLVDPNQYLHKTFGSTGLYIACISKQINVLKFLLAQPDIDVNKGIKRLTSETGGGKEFPLHVVCEKGLARITMMMLLNTKIDIEKKDSIGKIAEEYVKSEKVNRLFREFRRDPDEFKYVYSGKKKKDHVEQKQLDDSVGKSVSDLKDFLTKTLYSDNENVCCDQFELKFPKQPSVFVNVSFIIRSPILQALVVEEKYTHELTDEFHDAAEMMKKWVLGEYPKFANVNLLKMTFYLAQDLELHELVKYCVAQVDVQFTDIKATIDLIFMLQTEKKREKSLFLKSQYILQKHHEKVGKEAGPYLFSKGTTPDTQPLVIEIMSQLPYAKLARIEKHVDFENCANGYNLVDDTTRHIASLCYHEATKNQVLKTVDGKLVKIHKEIVMRREWFNELLKEHVKEPVVFVNFEANMLSFVVRYIYTSTCDLENVGMQVLLTLINYCRRLRMDDMLKVVQEDFDKKFKKASFTKERVLQMMKDNAKVLVHNCDLSYENINLKKLVDEMDE